MIAKFDPRRNYGGEPEGSNRWRPVEEGLHVFQVVKAESKTSRSGNPMVEVELEVVGKRDKSVGLTAREWFTLEADWLWKLKRFCDAIDPAMPGGDDPDALDVDSTASLRRRFVGKLLVGRVWHKPDTFVGRDGRTRNTVRVRFGRKDWRELTAAERDKIEEQYGSPDGPTRGGGREPGSDDDLDPYYSESGGDAWPGDDPGPVDDFDIPF